MGRADAAQAQRTRARLHRALAASASTQTTSQPPAVQDRGVSCYLLVDDGPSASSSSSSANERVEPAAKAGNERRLHAVIRQLQDERGQVSAQVELLSATCNRLMMEKKQLAQQHEELRAAIEQKHASTSAALHAKLLDVSSQLAKSRIERWGNNVAIGRVAAAPLSVAQAESPTLPGGTQLILPSSPSSLEEALTALESLQLQLRSAEREIERLTVANQTYSHQLSASDDMVKECRTENAKIRGTAMLLQQRLREKSAEVDAVQTQLTRLQAHSSQMETQRANNESELRNSIVALTKLRGMQENQLIAQYRAERNVVSFIAYEDLQLQLADQQEQLAETRSILLQLIGEQEQHHFPDSSASPLTPHNRQNLAVAPSPIFVPRQQQEATVVQLAKRALREKSLSMLSPMKTTGL